MEKISLRIDSEMIEKLKKEAKNYNIGYTTMIRIILKQHYSTKELEKELENLK